MSRIYRRDRRGRFAATPGTRVLSALDEAESALKRATDGVAEIAEARQRAEASRRRTVRRSALAGAAVGALVPAPAPVKVTTSRAALFAAATTTTGYKLGQKAGRARSGSSATAGHRVRR